MLIPNANITGVYTTLQDMIYNSYKFLQKIALWSPDNKWSSWIIPSFRSCPKKM